MFKNSLVYTTSTLLSSLCPFLLLPFLTRVLSPEDYGQISLFSIFVTLLGAIIGINSNVAANRKFFDVEKQDSLLLKRYNSNCILIFLFSIFLVSVSLIIFKEGVSKLLEIPTSWIFLAIISSSSNFIFQFRLGQWQVRSRVFAFGFFQVLSSVSNLFLTGLLVFYWDMASYGRVVAISGALLLMGTLSMISLWRDNLISLKPTFIYTKEILVFGAPLIPHVMASGMMIVVDRFLIVKMIGLDEAGIYMVAASIAGIFGILFNSINKAYVPWLFGQLKNDDINNKLKIVKNTYLSALFLLFFALIFYLLAPGVLSIILGPGFSTVASLVPVLVLGQCFYGIYLMLSAYLFYSKSTEKLSYISLFCGLLNVVTLVYFVPEYGVLGACCAFVLSCFVKLALTWFFVTKSIRMPWFYGLRREAM